MFEWIKNLFATPEPDVEPDWVLLGWYVKFSYYDNNAYPTSFCTGLLETRDRAAVIYDMWSALFAAFFENDFQGHLKLNTAGGGTEDALPWVAGITIPREYLERGARVSIEEKWGYDE